MATEETIGFSMIGMNASPSYFNQANKKKKQKTKTAHRVMHHLSYKMPNKKKPRTNDSSLKLFLRCEDTTKDTETELIFKRLLRPTVVVPYNGLKSRGKNKKHEKTDTYCAH